MIGSVETFTPVVLHEPYEAVRIKECLDDWLSDADERIAASEALLQLRRSQRTVSLTATTDADPADAAQLDLPDEAPLPEQQLDDLQQLHLLRLSLDQLDARCHGLLSMLFADDEDRPPYEQIALRLDMPVGSIGPTRARCLSKLRTLLARAGSGLK